VGNGTAERASSLPVLSFDLMTKDCKFFFWHVAALMVATKSEDPHSNNWVDGESRVKGEQDNGLELRHAFFCDIERKICV
jgi:hypothetical protein